MKDKTIMEGSYILAFYQNIGTLNNYYAQYQNLMLEVKYSHGNSLDSIKKVETLPEEQTNAIRQATQSLRIIAVQTYMQYESLKKHIKILPEEDKTLQELYDKVTEQYIPETKDIKAYVLILNKLLTNDIMQDLFDKSQEIIDLKNG